VRRGAIVRLVTIGLVAGLVAAAVAIFIPWLPAEQSKEAGRIDFVFWFVTAICIAVFAVVASITIYSVVKFRARPDDDSDGPPIHGHTGIEIAWTAVPAALVTAIAIVSAVALAENGKLKANRLKVDVTAQQFAWHFKYPQYGGFSSDELRLEQGRQVELNLRALDVIHSFWVPEFRQKQDAVPGIVTHLPITPTKTGRHTLMCTELCGLGHALMRAPVIVMKKDAFERWARLQQRGTGSATGASG
jgi:cytochrome c oxidase subunit II